MVVYKYNSVILFDGNMYILLLLSSVFTIPMFYIIIYWYLATNIPNNSIRSEKT